MSARFDARRLGVELMQTHAIRADDRRWQRTSAWRSEAAPIVAAALAEAKAGDMTDAQREKLLRAVYPFGPRKHHPYKCWLAEIKHQLNPNAGRRKPQSPPAPNPNQEDLF